MIDTLLIDDDTGFLDLAKTYLEKERDELNIETIHFITSALELIDEYDFDCVVCDYQMPEMDGLELLEKVREDFGDDVPFILLTGKGREEVAVKALNLGADRYLQKKNDPKSQFSVLAQAIKQEAEHYRVKKRFELTSFSLENSSIGALWIKPDGTIKYANKKICKKLGYSRGELIGKKTRRY